MDGKTEHGITPATKVGEMLEHFPELESVLLATAPAFEKLKNPVLRKTVAKVATLTQAAQIAGIPPLDLVNRLRAAAGMEPLHPNPPAEKQAKPQAQPQASDVPEWVSSGTIRSHIDADAALAEGVHPLAQVMRESASLGPGDILELTVSFHPVPLIEKLEQSGCRVFTQATPGGGFRVFAGR